MVSPSVRKAAAWLLEEEFEYSERRACEVALISRGALRYAPRIRPDEPSLRQWIRETAYEHPRYGSRRTWVTLRREGATVGKNRVHRIWKDEGLQLPRRRPKRRRHVKGEVVRKAERRNHVWTYDFMEDRTVKGGRLRILNVVEEYTRECLAARVEKSMSAREVIDTLEWLFLMHGAPEHIRSDNGPEFVAEAVKRWLSERGCGTIYIEPGSPWENPYIESFNGKMRDECLNMEIFANGQEARELVENWRVEYNERRPHPDSESGRRALQVSVGLRPPSTCSPHNQVLSSHHNWYKKWGVVSLGNHKSGNGR